MGLHLKERWSLLLLLRQRRWNLHAGSVSWPMNTKSTGFLQGGWRQAKCWISQCQTVPLGWLNAFEDGRIFIDTIGGVLDMEEGGNQTLKQHGAVGFLVAKEG